LSSTIVPHFLYLTLTDNGLPFAASALRIIAEVCRGLIFGRRRATDLCRSSQSFYWPLPRFFLTSIFVFSTTTGVVRRRRGLFENGGDCSTTAGFARGPGAGNKYNVVGRPAKELP
jgi:hypothetical protein